MRPDIEQRIYMNEFEPRPEQLRFFLNLENNNIKRAMLVWPRKFGKDTACWQFMVREAIRKVGTYIYCLPSFSMCRRVLLSSILSNGRTFIEDIPPSIIQNFNKQEMKLRLINGSIIIMVGSDNASERLVGMSAQGIVISEAAQADPSGISYLLPMIAQSDGFLVINSTPRGHNKFWELYNTAKRNIKWFVSKLTVDDTKHISVEKIQEDIDAGLISEELARQEYWTSFDSLNEGAYYATYIDRMLVDDRITNVPYEPSLPVYVFIDLGWDDSTAMIFAQFTGTAIHIIDYYENNNEGLEFYVNVIREKRYGLITVYAPHDINVHELNTGISRLEKLRGLGVDVEIVPKLNIHEGIEAVRTMLPKTYIDIKKCDFLVKAIENYVKEKDEKNGGYKEKPRKGRWNHANDALRYLAVCHKRININDYTAEDLHDMYEESMSQMIGEKSFGYRG